MPVIMYFEPLLPTAVNLALVRSKFFRNEVPFSL